jgi:DNA-binding winged helix-turn-helix (wHTH) protein
MRFRWGECELDRETRSLARAGRVVRVQPLVLDLLLLLLRHRSRVVSENVLRRELWHGVRVSEASLRRLVKEARRTIGDDGERQRQIETVRGRGLRFAAPVGVEDGPDTAFVGRSDLLQELEQTLEAVAAGRGGVTLLHGPAGIGKTSLLAELEARAEALDFRVLRGAGRIGAEGDTFHPWLDASSELGIDRVLRGGMVPTPSAARAAVSDETRFAGFRDVARALVRGAEDRPLLVALDDLQFADGDSLALLRFVAPLLRGARVWIVGALRSSTGVGGEGRLRDLGVLATETSTQVLALRGLEPDELRAVVEAQLRVEVSAESAERLASRAEGNPLFAVEIARSLHAEGRTLGGEPPGELVTGVAATIRSLVERRSSALTPDVKRLLVTASAIGNEFDPRLLAEAERRPLRGLARALDEAAALGLLDPPVRSTRRFAHPLFAEALYAELAADPLALAGRHLRIAEALERMGLRDPFPLARHFVASRPVSSAARVLPYARAAAEEARRRSAVANSAFWYRHAVALAEEASAPASEICELLLAESEVLAPSTGLDSARVPAERAARIALAEREPRLLARAALAFAHRANTLGDQAPGVEWLRAARDAPSGDVSLDVLVASRLGARLAVAGPEQAVAARALLQESEATARALEDPQTLARVLFDVNASSFAADEPRGWLARAEELERCARASGDLELSFRALCGCVAAHMQLGERAGAKAALAASQRFASEYPTWYTHGVTRGIEAMLALIDGRFGDARAAIADSEQDARVGGSGALLAQTIAQRFWLAREEGDLARFIPVLEGVRTRLPRFALVSAATALAYCLSGMLEPALDALGAVVDALPTLPTDWYRLPALALASEVTFRAGAPIAAAALQEQLVPYAELGVISYNAATYYGSVSQALGWLSAARGRSGEAVGHFERALGMHTALRSEPWMAHSRRAVAEVEVGRRIPRRRA